MAFTAGTKLGPYEIQSPIGAGGVGEVYRALDTRLDRTVAVKVLASHLSSSPELKQRMEREARAISSLNHPHICHLYDIGSQDDTNCDYCGGMARREVIGYILVTDGSPRNLFRLVLLRPTGVILLRPDKLSPTKGRSPMADKKIIAVAGAQGGGLARAILADPNGGFACRAITRDPNKDKAKDLAGKGAEVVKADLDDVDTLKKAFAGAYGAYCVNTSPEKRKRHRPRTWPRRRARPD